MSDNEQTADTAVAEAAKKAARAEIVRGTIPKALVFQIRFNEAGNKESEVAKKYGTTTGKVADIVKGRNFAYIDESYKPTAEEKVAAIAWLKSVPGYDEVGTDAVVTAVDKMDVASDEDVAALKAKRASVRQTNAASSGNGNGDGANGDGGEKKERRSSGGKKGKAPPQTASKADVDQLMQ